MTPKKNWQNPKQVICKPGHGIGLLSGKRNANENHSVGPRDITFGRPCMWPISVRSPTSHIVP